LGALLGEKIQKIQMLIEMKILGLMLLHRLLLHHLEFALDCREIYVITNNILMVRLDIVCCPLQVNHIHSQRL
jgi:hypothetical protein